MNRQIEQQELEQAVVQAEQIVQQQEVTAEQEEAEVKELEMELREAEMTAERQATAENEGRNTERQISEVAGA